MASVTVLEDLIIWMPLIVKSAFAAATVCAMGTAGAGTGAFSVGLYANRLLMSASPPVKTVILLMALLSPVLFEDRARR